MQDSQHRITIAIDGYSSCGKSTLAMGLARRLHYLHIDSGAMYRAVTLYFLRNRIDVSNEDEVENALDHINIHLEFDHESQNTLLNNENVNKEIRGTEVNAFVSKVSTLSNVRRAMVAQQRKMGEEQGLVMDGRDIGTIVFPEAELKLFLTADIEIRVDRRWLELKQAGINLNRDEVRANLEQRDHIDSKRKDSPLCKAADATIIDTSYLSEKEQLQIAYDLSLDAIFKNKQNASSNEDE